MDLFWELDRTTDESTYLGDPDEWTTYNLLKKSFIIQAMRDQNKKLFEFFANEHKFLEIFEFVCGKGKIEEKKESPTIHAETDEVNETNDENDEMIQLSNRATELLTIPKSVLLKDLSQNESLMIKIHEHLLDRSVESFFYSNLIKILHYLLRNFTLTILNFWFGEYFDPKNRFEYYHEESKEENGNDNDVENKNDEKDGDDEMIREFAKFDKLILDNEEMVNIFLWHLDKSATIELFQTLIGTINSLKYNRIILKFLKETNLIEKLLDLMSEINGNFDYNLALSSSTLIVLLINDEREQIMRKMINSTMMKNSFNCELRHIVQFAPFSYSGEYFQSKEFIERLLDLLVKNKNNLLSIRCIVNVLLVVSLNRIEGESNPLADTFPSTAANNSNFSPFHTFSPFNDDVEQQPHTENVTTELSLNDSREFIMWNICVQSLINLMKFIQIEHINTLVDVLQLNEEMTKKEEKHEEEDDLALCRFKQDIEMTLVNLMLPTNYLSLISKSVAESDMSQLDYEPRTSHKKQYVIQDITTIIDISTNYYEKLFSTNFPSILFRLTSVHLKKNFFQKNFFRFFDFLLFSSINFYFQTEKNETNSNYKKMSYLLNINTNCMKYIDSGQLSFVQLPSIRKLFHDFHCLPQLLAIYENNSFSYQNCYLYSSINKSLLIIKKFLDISKSEIFQFDKKKKEIKQFVKDEIIPKIEEKQWESWKTFIAKHVDTFESRLFDNLKLLKSKTKTNDIESKFNDIDCPPEELSWLKGITKTYDKSINDFSSIEKISAKSIDKEISSLNYSETFVLDEGTKIQSVALDSKLLEKDVIVRHHHHHHFFITKGTKQLLIISIVSIYYYLDQTQFKYDAETEKEVRRCNNSLSNNNVPNSSNGHSQKTISKKHSKQSGTLNQKFEKTFVATMSQYGQMTTISDKSLQIDILMHSPESLLQILSSSNGDVKREIRLNRHSEHCQVGTRACLIANEAHDNLFILFDNVSELNRFKSIMNDIRTGIKKDSIFADRTEDGSAEQYFQYYGYLSQQQNMMQDYIRTSTYQRAMLDNLDEFRDAVVIDVGTGSGILSHFALQAGAKRVYAIEASSIAQHAQHLVDSNQLNDRLKIVTGKVEDIDLPEKADIIISEPMGYMLINERMLESYIHARKFLKPNGNMYPTKGILYCIPFCDEMLYMEMAAKGNFWTQKCFFNLDISSLQQAAIAESFRQPIVDTFDIRICDVSEESQYYEIDFLKSSEESLHTISFPVKYRCRKTSNIHGLAFWFDVAFIGKNVTSWLTTAPGQPLTHWYQVRCCLPNPIFVFKGEILKGHIEMIANKKQSYDIKMEMFVDGREGITRSTNELDLKNPYFRYTNNVMSQMPMPDATQITSHLQSTTMNNSNTSASVTSTNQTFTSNQNSSFGMTNGKNNEDFHSHRDRSTRKK
ncbi:hypothetical protein SNEBB_009490 [Seison nebaliae]|nr:hypothetical protein SNEBB_009490 [Seison nebaliae]